MNLDSQQFFNLVIAVAGFLGVYVFNQVMQRLTKVEDENAALREHIPKEYVQKLDYRKDIDEVKLILRQIFDKLDGKADKP